MDIMIAFGTRGRERPLRLDAVFCNVTVCTRRVLVPTCLTLSLLNLAPGWLPELQLSNSPKRQFFALCSRSFSLYSHRS